MLSLHDALPILEPGLDRGRVADLLVDPRLVEPQRADAGFDIADRLDVAGEIADRPTVVIEAVDMELGAGPARDLFEIGLEHEVEVVEIARAAPPPARDIAHQDRKNTRLNSSHYCASRMPSSA